MKLPPELEDSYVKEVLYNKSLENLPDEQWKLIEGFENYAISNYGRVKSLERDAPSLFGRERTLPEMILKPVFTKHFNKYLNRYFYNVNARLSLDGKKTEKPISRLVYYHFVEKFDMNDQHIYIETMDDNRLHVNSSNLKMISASERSLKTFRTNKAKNRHVFYLQPISQYTLEGDHIADFDSFYDAEKAFGIDVTAIYSAITKKALIAGAYRWFLQSDPPQKDDLFFPDQLLNEKLWQRLGKPKIDKKNPPPCMNLSIKNLIDENWKALPGFEERFSISNKGRIKRMGSWNTVGRKIYTKEHIVPQIIEFKDDTLYTMRVILDDLKERKRKTSIEISRLLYYCFIEQFDLNNKRLVIVSKNHPQWKIDLSKLELRYIKDIPKNKRLKSIRIVNTSREVFNDVLWEKLGKPTIDKKNPPAIMNLSLKDLQNERWKPLTGYKEKYAISNKGRVKRLSGWKAGNMFFEEEQILNINLMKVKNAFYLCFRLHERLRRSSIVLPRILYYSFVEEFDLNDKTLIVVNENEPMWDIDSSKLSLQSSQSVFRRKTY
ncbi:NUMOD4 domain-containing protein [Chryseobacterium sp. B21-037]|uniref:NUMOD4 domain-containing protein n=1 Tax=Chryseobacterium sp. B21-037 TaxID=2926038 RepID=UPI002358C5A2|nr:NUMOD4 domain-containing protein [Chryseobacterium sp. B21-037]MDC8105491.1 NUMOD4 domain-containing protein [Chryseobacterium sp. B21-037]